MITRWRLSNFNLAIETGRHQRNKVDRALRICKTCLVLEDESHVFFVCPLYSTIRKNHPTIFQQESVKEILNPTSREIAYETAKILFAIEKIHEKLNR